MVQVSSPYHLLLRVNVIIDRHYPVDSKLEPFCTSFAHILLLLLIEPLNLVLLAGLPELLIQGLFH